LSKTKKQSQNDIDAIIQFLKGFTQISTNTAFIACEWCQKYPGQVNAVKDGYCSIRDDGEVPSKEGFCKGFMQPVGVSVTDGLVNGGPDFFANLAPNLD